MGNSKSDETSRHFVPLFTQFDGTIVLSGWLQGAFFSHANIISLGKDWIKLNDCKLNDTNKFKVEQFSNLLQ